MSDQKPTPRMLHHYTREAGFIGIVRSQSLRAGEFLSMNDRSEWTYAYSLLAGEALEILRRAIPEDVRNELGIQLDLTSLMQNLRSEVENTDGYGSLFITSFARANSDHEEEDGILTLWHRYTDNEGFCFKFTWKSIQDLIDREKLWHSYSFIELLEVSYGVDETAEEFISLARDLARHMQFEMYKRTRDHRLAPDRMHDWNQFRFLRDILIYCGRHKNPHFVDEREVRIFTIPAPKTEVRAFVGAVRKKPIYRLWNEPTGRRYIVLGEGHLPGILADEFIIGPKAEFERWKLDALYPRWPRFSTSKIPIE